MNRRAFLQSTGALIVSFALPAWAQQTRPQIETRKAELQMQQQPKAKEAGKSKSSVLSGLSMN